MFTVEEFTGEVEDIRRGRQISEKRRALETALHNARTKPQVLRGSGAGGEDERKKLIQTIRQLATGLKLGVSVGTDSEGDVVIKKTEPKDGYEAPDTPKPAPKATPPAKRASRAA